MDKWLNHHFESSVGLTEDFAAFAKDFQKEIKKATEPQYKLVTYSRGHFYISGFLKSKDTGKFIYFSISDVRAFSNEWYNQILVRTAKDEKDYTGGINNFTSLENLLIACNKLARLVKPN